MPLSMPRWSGLTGSTIADCWNPSETFHQQNEKGRIIVNWRSRVKLPDSNKPVSGITGAVQFLVVSHHHDVLIVIVELEARHAGRCPSVFSILPKPEASALYSTASTLRTTAPLKWGRSRM